MKGELPRGWAECTIGEIAKVVGGGTPDASRVDNFSRDSGIAWITPADLSNYRDIYISRGKRYLTKQGYAGSSAKLMPKGTVLFTSRAPIGYVAIAANDISTNQGFKSFLCTPEIWPEYLYFWLKHARRLAEELANGTTFPEISGSNASRIPFYLAPTSEQQRIVTKLEKLLAKVDAIQEHLERIPIILKRFRHSVLAAACSGRLTTDWRELNTEAVDASDLIAELERSHKAAGGHKRGNAAPPTDEAHDLSEDELPSSWRMTDLRTATCPDRPITYGILKPGAHSPGGVPYVRVADYPNDKLNLGSIRRTTKDIDNAFARARLRKGDILLSIRGTVGRLCFVPPELQDANITQDTARVSIQPALNADFILWFLRAAPTQKRMQKAVKGVAVRGINIGDVRALQIPVPPRTEQMEIVRRVDALIGLADKIEARYQVGKKQVDNLTQSVLAKAFRGELVPTEAELAEREGRHYESAQQLLQRIRSSREVEPASRGKKRIKRVARPKS